MSLLEQKVSYAKMKAQMLNIAELNGLENAAADLNGDGKITLIDIAIVNYPPPKGSGLVTALWYNGYNPSTFIRLATVAKSGVTSDAYAPRDG